MLTYSQRLAYCCDVDIHHNTKGNTMNQIVKVDEAAKFDKLIELEVTRQPGVYFNMPNDDYHAGPGISKSGLWTIHQSTPAHYKYPAEVVETAASKATKAMGEATHTAVLEPNRFEESVVRGPDDRRGNKWSDLQTMCDLDGKVLLTGSDYDQVLAIRDTVHANSFLNGIITNGKSEVEASGYFIDPITGALCRVRPDLYKPQIKVMVDLKTTLSASAADFARSVTNYGYHSQEAFYTDGYSALKRPVDGFVFIALEKKSPYAVSVFELPPAIVEEGRAIMRKSLDEYASCLASGVWHGYPEGVQELKFKRWAYNLTEAPNGLDDETA
ncbi:hypothetical protein AX761_22710 [Rhizobium sp. 58]|nr:hypothetical protein AX761_22710 [Rhizobium sp. 58]